MKAGISAVVVVHNQLDLLKSCLASLKWVDEIILIDLESEGDVKAIAESYGATYLKHKNVAIVEHLRQLSLSYVHYEYVVFLDPDERLPKSLATDLLAKIKSDKYDYFVTPRQNYVFGKWVRHSRWWPDLQTRVFRHNQVSWGKELHAEPVATGVGYTYPEEERYAIEHHNYTTIDEYVSKNMRYAKADAMERLTSKQPFTLASVIKLSVSELMSRFFQGKGHKDGMHGLILALLQSYYYFLVYTYYWEAKKYGELESDTTIKSFPRTWFSHALSETIYWDKSSSPIKTIKEKLVRRMIG